MDLQHLLGYMWVIPEQFFSLRKQSRLLLGSEHPSQIQFVIRYDIISFHDSKPPLLFDKTLHDSPAKIKAADLLYGLIPIATPVSNLKIIRKSSTKLYAVFMQICKQLLFPDYSKNDFKITFPRTPLFI
jgi:hypothetical protein